MSGGPLVVVMGPMPYGVELKCMDRPASIPSTARIRRRQRSRPGHPHVCVEKTTCLLPPILSDQVVEPVNPLIHVLEPLSQLSPLGINSRSQFSPLSTNSRSQLSPLGINSRSQFSPLSTNSRSQLGTLGINSAVEVEEAH